MIANPQSFFRFAAQYYPLLRDLYYRSGGFNDADLRELILRHRSGDDPAPHYLADQLLRLGIIETTPEATASYEMTRPVKNLMRFLLQEQRLTSAAVIQGYLADLEQSQAELDAAIRETRPVRIERALNEIGETLERIRQDSRANREAVVNEVLALKTNRERRPVKERFEIINRLWTRYLEPLRDLIDVRKAMDSGLDALDRVLKAGAEAFELDGVLFREFSRCRARLLRLRRDVGVDFHEALREVEPLYESLKRDSELVRGAVRALERLGKEGLRGLALTKLLAIPFWHQEGLFSDAALSSFLQGVHGYTPRPPVPLATGEARAEADFIEPEEMLAALRRTLPVEDVLNWLLMTYRNPAPGEVLRAYGRIHGGEVGRPVFGPAERAYGLGTTTFLAHPLRLEADS